MLNYRDKTVLRIIKQLEGMSKIEVYDILQDIEILLNGQTSPISYEAIKNHQINAAIKNNVSSLIDQGYCYLIDSCQYLNVYCFKSSLPKFLGGESTFFTLKGNYKIIPLDNHHLKKTFEHTLLKKSIDQFLSKHRAQKKNPKTKRLLLLELLETVDCNEPILFHQPLRQ